MDINQLEVLVTVAKEKSFSRAAEVLGRTQPAVSQAVRRLEQEAGEKLFDRSSKDGTLTLAGEILFEYARQILNLRKNASRDLREMRELHRGRVTISANEHTVFFLLPIIERFRAQYPNIKVEVRRGVASRIPKEITAREVELGIISFKPKDPSLRSMTVFTDHLVLIVSPEHEFAGRSRVSVKDLGSQDFIAHNAVSPYRQMVVETFEKQNTPLRIAVELPSLEAIKRLVETGSGVALVPKMTAQSEIDNGTLVGVSVPEMKFVRKLNIIYRRNAALSHAAAAFLETAKKMNAG